MLKVRLDAGVSIRLLELVLAVSMVVAYPALSLGQAKNAAKRGVHSTLNWGVGSMPDRDEVAALAFDILNSRGDLAIGKSQSGERGILLNASRPSAASKPPRSPGTTQQRSSSLNPSGPPAATSDIFTNGAGSGLWSNPGNWSAGLPNSGDDVLITGSGRASSVTEDINATINNMTLNSGNAWTLNNNEDLTIDGSSISNAGNMTLNSTGSATTLTLNAPSVTLSGGGTLTLSNNVNNQIVGAATADTLTNQETIQGAGRIGGVFGTLTLVNSGTINANQSAGLTLDAAGGAVNTGTIEATGGALLLTGTTLNNIGGTISSSGQALEAPSSTIFGGAVTLTGAATLQLNNSVVEGGTLSNSSTGTIEVLAGFASTLGGVITNPTGGVLKIDNGAQLNLQAGTYASLGAVQLNSTGSAATLALVGGNVTLSGGSLALSNNVNNNIVGAVSTDTLTNQETITGAGRIGGSFGVLTLANSGTINANQSAGLTISAAGGATNSGTIEATGGPLLLTGTMLNNLGGTLSATGETLQAASSTINGGTVALNGAATLQLNNSVVENGALTNSSTGTIEVLPGFASTLGGTVTNPTGGILKIDNGAQLNLQGGTYASLGAVQLNSTGSATTLSLIDGNVTLSGGTLTLANNVNNNILGALSTDVLTNQETIQGAGRIGGSFGVLTLANSGTINANQSAGLTIDATGGVANTGTIEATAGSLGITGTIVNNAGGKITATNEALTVTSSTINGGTITLTGASTLQLNNSVIQGAALTSSSTGTIEVLAGFASALGGAITNPTGGVLKIDNGAQLNLQNGVYTKLGAVQLNSTGGATTLALLGNVTLSGGSVSLSNNPNNNILGSVATDTLTNKETIQGAGKIGGSFGVLSLVNSGTINANQSAGLAIDAAGGLINTGTIEATAGTLGITGTTVTNSGGKIKASAQALQVTSSTINGGSITLTGASTLQLNNSTIHGGSALTNSSTGTIEVLPGFASTLGGTITNPTGGVLKIDNGATLNLENGTYANLGSVQLNSTGSATSLILDHGNVTLSGGTLTLSNNANNSIFGAVSTDFLINQETIQGAGNIGKDFMGLINSGTMIANESTPLILQPDGLGFSNNGTLQVSAGDVLHVETGPFTNFIGSTLTGGTYNVTGTLEIDELGSSGGEIVTNAANIILTGATSSFVDAGSKDALVNLAANAVNGSFSIQGGRNFTTVGNFTNNGILTVGSSSKFDVNGSLTNQSGTTLSGGTYNVTGTLQYNGADVVTNAANITLTGTSSQIINQTSGDALANFATNAAAGRFTVTGGQTLADGASAFSNAGALTVGKSSNFTLTPGAASFTQTGGVTTVDGTLTAKGGITFSGGSLFGNGGTLVGNTTDSGTVNIGDALLTAGTETVSGNYTETSSGTLNIDIGGTTAGAQFDQFVITGAATLGGTLNLDLINGFVPTLGQMFDILNASGVSGTFATVNTPIFGTNLEFSAVYNANNVTLDVITAPAAPPSPASEGLLAANLPHSSPTPEPASLLLLGSGLLALGTLARRRPKAQVAARGSLSGPSGTDQTWPQVGRSGTYAFARRSKQTSPTIERCEQGRKRAERRGW